MSTSIIRLPVLAAAAAIGHIACDSPQNVRTPDRMEKQPVAVVTDTTPRVTGIGGIFFFSDDVRKSRAWYAEHLGLDTTRYGCTFEFRNANRPDEINYLQWSPFRMNSPYFAPSKKDFMINYRVQNLVGLVARLRNKGVTVVDSIETVEYGKFVHILDHEGNKLELWEPIDSVLTKLGGKTTK